MPHTLLFSLLCVTTPSPIVIDGHFDDWASVPVALVDPADAPEAAIDFRELRVTHDERFVHLLVDLGRVVNIQHLEGTARLLLDTDGNPRTGETVGGLNGVDAVVELTPPDPEGRGRRGRGVGLRVIGVAEPRNGYDIGFMFGPTYAGRRFELRMDRRAVVAGLPRFLVGGRFSGRLEFADVRGNVADSTDPFTHELSPVDPSPVEQAFDPLARPPGTDVRIVSWNVNFGGLLRRPEPFGRILRALEPDVILLQEILEDATPLQLVEFARTWIPGGGRRGRAWNALLGAGGGDLRSAVVTRLDLDTSRALHVVPFPDLPDRTIRVAAAVVGEQHRLLVLSVHLRCCGWAGGFEDRTRQVEADALRRAVRETLPAASFDGVIIAGDLNLVGSRRPLDLLAEGLDADGSALTVAEALQIDGGSNATWGDPDLPFAPGRLDFLLYADTSLESINAFVMDARDLEPRWLERHGLGSDDSASASDHLPVVVDLRWIDRKKR
ncbi:MAG: endonuclease/exonuclease/phosphatase family protein [Planctomycetota bacterium]|jgi:endonuclease/exonuclease/phosphatase family metal-dependent hydrolase